MKYFVRFPFSVVVDDHFVQAKDSKDYRKMFQAWEDDAS